MLSSRKHGGVAFPTSWKQPGKVRANVRRAPYVRSNRLQSQRTGVENGAGDELHSDNPHTCTYVPALEPLRPRLSILLGFLRVGVDLAA